MSSVTSAGVLIQGHIRIQHSDWLQTIRFLFSVKPVNGKWYKSGIVDNLFLLKFNYFKAVFPMIYSPGTSVIAFRAVMIVAMSGVWRAKSGNCVRPPKFKQVFFKFCGNRDASNTPSILLHPMFNQFRLIISVNFIVWTAGSRREHQRYRSRKLVAAAPNEWGSCMIVLCAADFFPVSRCDRMIHSQYKSGHFGIISKCGALWTIQTTCSWFELSCYGQGSKTSHVCWYPEVQTPGPCLTYQRI